MIIQILHNLACCYQILWDLQKCSNYIQALIFNFNSELKFSDMNTHQSNPGSEIQMSGSKKSVVMSERYESDRLEKKLQLSKYYLLYCAMNSQLKNNEGALVAAKKASQLTKSIFAQVLATYDSSAKQFNSNSAIHNDTHDNLPSFIYTMLQQITKTAPAISIQKVDDLFKLVRHFIKIYNSKCLFNNLSASKNPSQINSNKQIYQKFKQFSIGNIMQIHPIGDNSQSYKSIQNQNLSSSQLSLSLSYQKLIQNLIVFAICQFTMATELRYIALNKANNNRESSKQFLQFKQSQPYHLISILIIAMYIPFDILYMQHVISSYHNHYQRVLLSNGINGTPQLNQDQIKRLKQTIIFSLEETLQTSTGSRKEDDNKKFSTANQSRSQSQQNNHSLIVSFDDQQQYQEQQQKLFKQNNPPSNLSNNKNKNKTNKSKLSQSKKKHKTNTEHQQQNDQNEQPFSHHYNHNSNNNNHNNSNSNSNNNNDNNLFDEYYYVKKNTQNDTQKLHYEEKQMTGKELSKRLGGKKEKSKSKSKSKAKLLKNNKKESSLVPNITTTANPHTSSTTKQPLNLKSKPSSKSIIKTQQSILSKSKEQKSIQRKYNKKQKTNSKHKGDSCQYQMCFDPKPSTLIVGNLDNMSRQKVYTNNSSKAHSQVNSHLVQSPTMLPEIYSKIVQKTSTSKQKKSKFQENKSTKVNIHKNAENFKHQSQYFNKCNFNNNNKPVDCQSKQHNKKPYKHIERSQQNKENKKNRKSKSNSKNNNKILRSAQNDQIKIQYFHMQDPNTMMKQKKSPFSKINTNNLNSNTGSSNPSKKSISKNKVKNQRLSSRSFQKHLSPSTFVKKSSQFASTCFKPVASQFSKQKRNRMTIGQARNLAGSNIGLSTLTNAISPNNRRSISGKKSERHTFHKFNQHLKTQQSTKAMKASHFDKYYL